MKTFCVKTECPELSEAIQKLAFKAGYSWSLYEEIQHTEKNYLTFQYYENKKFLGYSDLLIVGVNVLSIPEIIKRLKTQVTITIGDYYATISQNGQCLQIECQNISFKTVRQVYEQMKEIQSGQI